MKPSGSDPALRESALTAGFYALTVAATFLSTIDLRIRPVPGGPSFAIVELVVHPILLCLLAEAIARPRFAARVGELFAANRPLVLYVGYAALASIIGGARSSDSLQACKDLIAAFGLYALIVLTVDSHARQLGILIAFLCGALVHIGLAVVQAQTGGPYLVPLSENIEAKLDFAGNLVTKIPTGLLAHPNGLAILLLPVALFSIAATWPGLGWVRRPSIAMACTFAMTLLVLKLTYVKGVFAWLAAGLVFLVLPRRFDRWRTALAVGAVVGGVAALTAMSLQAFLEGEHVFGTILSRIELWLAAIEVLRSDNFVVVFGSGDALFAQQSLITFDYPNAHNAWLNQALTYGVPAMVLYLAAFFVGFRSLAQQIARSAHPARPLALAAMASLMALLGESFFEPTDRGVLFQAELFVLFGLASIGRGRLASRPEAT
jgi:O-antigen ligase